LKRKIGAIAPWVAFVAVIAGSSSASGADWLSAGQDLNNSHSQPTENKISVTTASKLKLKWAYKTCSVTVINKDGTSTTTIGDVTANPSVDGKFVYFPDSLGCLHKVDMSNGKAVAPFPVSLANLLNIPGENSRSTPAIYGNFLILGSQSGKATSFNPAVPPSPPPHPAHVFAIDKNTGTLAWDTVIDSSPTTYVTSGIAVSTGGVAIAGVASNEELLAGIGGNAYNFVDRGSVVALDASSGTLLWKTYMEPPGYHGADIWGSTAAIGNNTVYVGTGNNHAVPAGVAPGTEDPADYFDSIVSLTLNNGTVNWAAASHTFGAWPQKDWDAYNVGCGLDLGRFWLPFFTSDFGGTNVNCPNPTGPDWDFAQGPMLFAGLIGGGQKSGVFSAFDAKTGNVAWQTQVAPGGLTGGLQWGSATDGRRIYVAVSNSGPTGSGLAPQPWLLANFSTTQLGGWAALDAATGKILWTTADPFAPGGTPSSPANVFRAEGSVAVANGVVFGCDIAGNYVGLNAASGNVVWSWNQNSSGLSAINSNLPWACAAGPSIADGMVFWGSGQFRGNGSGYVYAFGF